MMAKKKAKRRRGEYPPGTVLHPTEDRPLKHVVRGPAWTPITHRPHRRARVLGMGTDLDGSDLVQLALSDDFTFLLAQLGDRARGGLILEALDALRLTDAGYSRALIPVRLDDDAIAWACTWPATPVPMPKLARPPIAWRAP